MQARGEDVIVLDGRPYSEYRKMNIPGAICCPNGELGYRLHDLVARDSTTIVINCAGRTRSIVGAQTLINLGIPNPVYALENGTQGWYLNDLKLEHGSTRRYPQDLAHGRLEQMQAAAQRLAHRFDVPLVEPATVERWAKDEQRTLFLCDVRTPEEFARGSLGGAQHTPGGQLIQATDQYIGVRHARLVLFDSDGIRATIVASWLRQMGHDASVLKGGLASGLALEQPQPPGLAALPSVTVEQLARGLAVGEIAAIDLRPSMQYRLAHVPGSAWSIRPRLAAQLATEHRHLVLIDDDPRISQAAATGLADMPLASVSRLEGGFDAWRAAGLEVVAGPNSPPDALCIDYLFFVHDRHDGNKAAARQYLAWETNLVSQLDQLELDSFTFDFPHHNKETTNAG
jgi:rhodanese-related sulfurtransferase